MSHALKLRFTFALWLVLLYHVVTAITTDEPRYVVGSIDGTEYRVRDDRRPALYTADYGDCLGDSLINVTRFDAAYYKDNMTVLFHLAGQTALANESIMMSIGVYAYGSSRFELTFNPCSANIDSACPVIAGVPIDAAGIIPINQNDVAGIPDIALVIPDFEGQAILRIFSNSTQAEIGCFASQITNGNTFRQKTGVGAVLGVFTVIAVLSSFVTAIYGDNVVETRKHYADSLSVMVVFAVWHHIYFSGALSMNWPNVLVSFWSNYAWTGGMIYSEHMQNIINEFIGSNKGNTSHVGAAGTGVNTPDLGGGYNIQAIYKRETDDPTRGFVYTGQPVKPGLPLPGNFSGFAGTLAQEKIPASNAFMTCLLWSLILVVCLIVSIMAFKMLLEALNKMKLLKGDRLTYFRAHFTRYTLFAVLRTTFIGFFMMAFLSMFQFSYLKSPGPVAVACVVFLIVVFGVGTAAGIACYWRVRGGKYVCVRDKLSIERTKLWSVVPWCRISRQSTKSRSEDKIYIGSMPWWTIQSSPEEKSIHDDERFIKNFGWLASRYRHTRWWFFAFWLVYEFTRACFLAGASSQPLVQVFGLLAVEVFALVVIIYLRPFEGQRVNIVLVYLLGSSKVATTALAAAFDTRFNLPRILATVIGIVIIVIQGLLTLVLLVAILLRAITSYFSITRSSDGIRPKEWKPARDRYFKRLSSQDDKAAPGPRSISVAPMRKAHKGPYFSVNQVQRVPKVEDEDDEFVQEIYNDRSISRVSVPKGDETSMEASLQRSRAASNTSQVSHTTLPRAARVLRPTWKSQDFSNARTVGRARALSSTMSSTPERSTHPTNATPPHSTFLSSSSESVCRQSSPIRMPASRPGTPANMPVSHSIVDGDEMGLIARPGSRPSVRSRSNSKLTREETITEEDVPPIPQKSSSKLLSETEQLQ